MSKPKSFLTTANTEAGKGKQGQGCKVPLRGPDRPDQPPARRPRPHRIVEAARRDNGWPGAATMGHRVAQAVRDLPAVPHPVRVGESVPAREEAARQAQDARECAVCIAAPS